MSNLQSFAARLQVVYAGSPEAEVSSPVAFDQGYSEGYAAGQARALEEFKAQSDEQRRQASVELTNLIEECKFKYQDWLTSMESPLAALSVVIAAKIIGRELAQNPDCTTSWVQQALQEVTSDTKATIRVSPLAAAHTESLSGGPIDIVLDPAIVAGCVIETEHGMIDARIDSMLAESLCALREAA